MSADVRGRPMAFGHVGLHVSDIDRSLRYYRDIIGLEEVERRIRDDAYLAVVTGYPGLRMDTCLMVDPASGVMLELLQVLSTAGTAGTPGTAVEPATAVPGTMHLCLVVDDVDAVHQRAVDSGFGAVNDPVTPTVGRWAGGRSVYLLDPDRIRVEIVQPGPAA